MPAKAMVPVDALPYIHLASEPLGFGRHMTVRRHSHVSALIHRFRGHGPLLQGLGYAPRPRPPYFFTVSSSVNRPRGF